MSSCQEEAIEHEKYSTHITARGSRSSRRTKHQNLFRDVIVYAIHIYDALYIVYVGAKLMRAD